LVALLRTIRSEFPRACGVHFLPTLRTTLGNTGTMRSNKIPRAGGVHHPLLTVLGQLRTMYDESLCTCGVHGPRRTALGNSAALRKMGGESHRACGVHDPIFCISLGDTAQNVRRVSSRLRCIPPTSRSNWKLCTMRENMFPALATSTVHSSRSTHNVRQVSPLLRRARSTLHSTWLHCAR
jgi:hypothetical protein